MNGLTSAKGLRRSVEGAGGVMRISVPALGDTFGRGKLTTRARTGIESVLAKAGIEVVPGLNDPANDGWVTLRLSGADAPVLPLAPPRHVARPESASPLAVAAAAPSAGADRPGRFLRPVPFLAAALTFLVPVLLVIALASPEANRPGRAAAAPTERTAPAPTAGGTLLERADTALLAGDYRTAVRLTTEADRSRVPALRTRIAVALTAQARTAQRQRAYVRAIKLARRAARFGRAPGAQQIVAASREGLDVRREVQRRAAATRRATRASG